MSNVFDCNAQTLNCAIPEKILTDFYTEFVVNSAISPDLYHANVEVVADEVVSYGEISRPITEALNWNSSRWDLCGKAKNYGAIIKTVDLDTGDLIPFQVKLANPIVDTKRNRTRKYENPANRKQVGGFACVTREIWQKVAERNRINLPALPNKSWYGKEFWDWTVAHNIDVIITEGFKKAASLLSLGYVAIALSGITMGRNDDDGVVSLQTYLEKFATQGRNVYFCFDAETKAKTQFDIYLAQSRTGKLFADKKCNVKIIQLPLLPNTDKTGVDDLIVAQGKFAFVKCFAKAQGLFSYEWSFIQSRKLLSKPALTLNAKSLLNSVTSLPLTGIIAIASGKGTEKTKLIEREVANDSQVIAPTHLISLGKNLSKRLFLRWRNDSNSKGEARLALCIHSLLSINPRDYQGCTLVLDEVSQLLRCVLTNNLCNKDGKRPALLARLEHLIKVAKRIIIADADLTDGVIDYIKRLKGDSNPVYLIRNDYKSTGYNFLFIESHNDKAIVSKLITDLKERHKIMVCTDSKEKVKALSQTIEDLNLGLRVMTIDSDNSSDEIVSNFIENINEQVLNFDVLICSPSLNTGVSIEVEHFTKVYGIYEGVLPDSDYSQSLSRYRPLVDRVVWCKSKGLNLSKVSKSTYAKAIKDDLYASYEAEIGMIRTSLSPDIIPFINDGYTFENNPHIDLFCEYTALENQSIYNLADNLKERLKFEGNNLTMDDCTNIQVDKDVENVYRAAKEFGKEQLIVRHCESKILNGDELRRIESKENKSEEERVIVTASKMANFYAVDALDRAFVEFDSKGKKRDTIIQLEAILHPETAIAKDVKAIEKQKSYNVGFVTPWDTRMLELKRRAREESGFTALLDKLANGDSLDNESLSDWYANIKKYAKVYESLGFAAKQKKSAIYLFRRWCEQCAIPTQYSRKKVNGQWHESVTLDLDKWQFVSEIIARRAARRDKKQPNICQDTTLETLAVNEVKAGHNSLYSLYKTASCVLPKVTEYDARDQTQHCPIFDPILPPPLKHLALSF